MPGIDDKFFWGVATSAFQQEGYIENDMTEWEALGRFKENGKDPKYNHGSKHWKRWKEDFEFLKKLRINAYRFSIEWARIEPEIGYYNFRALEVYKKMIKHLQNMNIKPILTLHHFTHPKWFHKVCPWHEEQSIEVFMKYVDLLLSELGDRIEYFVTLNEPLVWALAAYGDAKFPPGEKNLVRMMDALVNMLRAHKLIYDRIKKAKGDAQIGIAKNFIVFKPGRNWFILDQGVCDLVDKFYNSMILEAFVKNRLQYTFPILLEYNREIELDNAIDFWGINYYYRMNAAFRFSFKKPMLLYFKNESTEGQSDLGWENYARGLKKIIRRVAQTGKDMIITENGVATADDQIRIKYLRKHIKVVRKAVKKGLPLKGYFYWSFLDNYEWLEGKSARFGLVEVDYENGFSRTLRPSGEYYAQLIKTKSKP